MKRTPLKRGKPLARGRKPIATRSAKAKAADAVLDEARAERIRLAGGLCEGHTPACPPGPHPGAHAHHVVTRARGGAHTVANLRFLCLAAHDWAHTNPSEAAERGLLARKGDR